MTKSFRLFVEPRQVANAVLDLSQVEGVEVSLVAENLQKPDEAKSHPSYSISFAELSPIIISVASATASLAAVATAILQYKKAARESVERKDSQPSKGPIIMIHDTTVPITDFPSPEMLFAYLKEKLEQQPEDMP